MNDSKRLPIEPAETSVLIVDDSVQYAAVLTRILKGVFGYQDVTAVESPEQARDLLRADPKRFGLLFVDYNFPGSENGGDFLQRLKADAVTEQCTAFLITSEPSVENLRIATAAGAIGLVAKPFDREELRQQIEKARLRIRTESGEGF